MRLYTPVPDGPFERNRGVFVGGVPTGSMAFEDLPAGWDVWSDEATKVVLAYRPDVFNTTDYPPPCMPTIYVSKGKRGRRPGRDRPAPDADWYVTLFLEPEVSRDAETADTRGDAESVAVDLARRFSDGEIDVRALYQVPREEYLDRLEELTGRD